jgi:uncharacterized membrane protein SpoIIM required for sporulation
MDLDTLIRRRTSDWERLGVLLDQLESGVPGDRQLLAELMALYRRAAEDLSRARTMTVNPEVLTRLNHLVGRAYRVVHGNRRRTMRWSALVEFYTIDLPAALVHCRRHLGGAALLLLLGALAGFVVVRSDPTAIHELIPEQFLSEDVGERIAHIEDQPERIQDTVAATTFAASLYTHNIQVAFLAFALGALTILGGWWLLLTNGVILGAVAAQYIGAGETTFFTAWVGPHGALELPAIAVAAAAGLRLGPALLLPGDSGRTRALRSAMPDACRLLGGAVTMLVFAGMIEGSFSQFSSKTVPYAVKIAVALLLLSAVLPYLGGLIRWQRPGADA